MYESLFKDRIEAGLLLSEKLKRYQDSNSVIIAVPKGGVPVGHEIAKRLHLTLDIVLSKKTENPSNKEFATGAVSQDFVIVDERPDVQKEHIEQKTIMLRELLLEKYQLYRSNHEPIAVTGKNVIIVDDGIATGNTLLLSIAMLRKKSPAKIIVAVPVLPYDTLNTFEQNTDELIYLDASKNFRGVGGFYQKFYQIEDDEVIKMLSDSKPNE
ncbi:phosphoribosyltransferase [Flavobacterium frigoris]|uniref:Phosphoribosyltransferase n=1 Tax=Flavobacterium frigoris (strain PS1) TaxID=1086011 RepID=H7FLP0_FLAFP|nr:phosphoribosyltransferase family protein [Flavobacterium frigoris]EIA10582.1 phosphoribosyltransferase [Flavobacterium frigoris PS1]